MRAVAEQVRRTIERLDLIRPAGRVIAALSGGSDSVALVYLLQALAPRLSFQFVGVAHLHHGLRGEAADLDEAFCRQLAARLGLPIEIGRADVAALARDRKLSLEDAGRQARYAFLQDAAVRFRADSVATGHTRDDQAETFLLRMVRGAGPAGLAGIYPRHGRVIRPLLEVSRAQLRGYLEREGASYREDESNSDTALLRNRVRHELMPLLGSRFAPSIVDVLSREASIAREDALLLDELAARVSPRLLTVTDRGTISLDLEQLRAQPTALARRVLRFAMSRAAPGRFVGFDHVDIVLRAVLDRAKPGWACDLPGQRAVFSRSTLALGRPHQSSAVTSEPNSFRIPLSIPGEVRLPSGQEVSAHVSPRPSVLPWSEAGSVVPPSQAILDAALVPRSLVVRSRRPGDRLRPLGAPGRRKLQDVLVDHKVPREGRDRVPVVVDADNDQIVWVAGHAASEDFRVTERTEAVVILKLEALE